MRVVQGRNCRKMDCMKNIEVKDCVLEAVNPDIGKNEQQTA